MTRNKAMACLLAVLAFQTGGCGSPAPKAAALDQVLEGFDASFRDAKTFRMAVTDHATYNPKDSAVIEFLHVLAKPDRLRSETRVARQNTSRPHLSVIAGGQGWAYDAAADTYRAYTAENVPLAMDIDPLIRPLLSDAPSAALRQIADGTLQYAGTEALSGAPCQVLTWDNKARGYHAKLFLDRDAFTPRRLECHYGRGGLLHVLDYVKVETGVPVDPALFVRPEEAKAAQAPSPVPGTPAPDLEALTLEGKPVRLADFQGKVVLLDFWFYL